jgi:hypothetical protein
MMTESEMSRYDINLQLIDLNTKIDEIVTVNEDGSYTVVINSRAASNRQEEAKLHAFEHILHDDFSEENVQEIEARAHHLEELKKQEEEKQRQLKLEAEEKRKKAFKKKMDALYRRWQREDEDKRRYGLYRSRDIASAWPNDIGYDEPW